MVDDEGSLPIKYRPKTWDDVVGNDATVKALKSIVAREKGRPHVIMFEGPSGCGKTSLSMIFTNELGCSPMDFHEYNISDMRGIDTAREIIRRVRIVPVKGEVKVYVLNECHMGTTEFWNAMLDVLEFTPEYVYFVLCTTEPERIVSKLATIRSQRAMVFPVNRLPRPAMVNFLKSIAKKEGVEFPDEWYREMASVSEGSPRAALTIMDKIIDMDDDEAAFAAISGATFAETEVKALIDFLMKGNGKWKEASAIIKGLDLTGSNPEGIRQGIAKYFGSVLLNKGEPYHHRVMVVFASEPWFYSGREKLIDAIYELCVS